MKFRLYAGWPLALCLGLAVLSVVRAQDVGDPVLPPRGGPPPLPSALTRREAVAEALAHNPGLTAAREQVAEAKAGIVIAKAWPDPQLVTEADQLSSFFSPHSASEHDVGLSFTVPFPDRTRLNGRVARAGWKQAQYALTQLEQQTASATAQAYDAVLVALRHHDDLRQSQDMSEQFLRRTEARFRAGTSARLDVLKAQVDYSKTQNELIANEREIANARATLNRLLGRPLPARIHLTDSLALPPRLPGLGALERIAVRSRPELKSIASQKEAARDSTRLARRFWEPDLNLTLWRSQIAGAPDSYKFDGGISLPLLFWQHKKGAIAQAEHRERELHATGNDLVAQVLLDVRTSYANATTAWRQAEYLRNELLPEARAVYRSASTSYKLGGSSALELLDAKGTLLDAESQYTDALGAVNDARADLERAIGAPLPPILPTHEK